MYDLLDRLVAVKYNNSVAYTVTYNGSGAVSCISDVLSGRSTDYEYDSLGRLIRAEQYITATGIVLLKTQNLYDVYGRASSSAYQVNGKTQSYSLLYKQNSSLITSFNTLMSSGEWMNTELVYDSLERVTTKATHLNIFSKTEGYQYLTNSTSTTSLVSAHTVDGVTYTYTYDKVGNITAVRKNGNLKYSYSYDKLGQLTEAVIYSDTYSTDYLADVYIYYYDKSGNITSVTYAYGESANYTETVTYSYEDASWGDLLTSYGSTSITYDAIGNPLKWRNASAIEWQGRRLSLFANANGEVYTYTYNADGIRTQKNICDANGDFAGSTEYIYDGSKLIAESSRGDWLYYFYDVNGTVSGISYNGTLYYFRKNLQGDVTGIYNAYGALVVEYEYTPYGAILSTTGSMANTIGAINPFRYRGYYYDTETGFYYLQTRYYDPVVGRFLNADVYASTGQGILGNNMFAYCNNDPLNMQDPNGCDPIPNWAIRILQGSATAEDYLRAMKINPDAWVGLAKPQIEKAVAIAKEWYHDKFKSNTNSESDIGIEFALYDSDRFEDETLWRDTIISGEISGPSWNPKEGSIGLGAVSINGTTGGWEGEYGSLQVFNFGHAEAGAEIKNGKINVGAMASVWSPDASLNFFGVKIEFGAEVITAGAGFHKNDSNVGFSLGLGLLGFTINIDW